MLLGFLATTELTEASMLKGNSDLDEIHYYWSAESVERREVNTVAEDSEAMDGNLNDVTDAVIDGDGQQDQESKLTLVHASFLLDHASTLTVKKRSVEAPERVWPTGNYTGGGQRDGESDNCTRPSQPLPWYNNSCDFVRAECKNKAELIDYLAFMFCDLPKVQVK